MTLKRLEEVLLNSPFSNLGRLVSGTDFAGEYVKSYLGTHFCFVVKADTNLDKDLT